MPKLFPLLSIIPLWALDSFTFVISIATGLTFFVPYSLLTIATQGLKPFESNASIFAIVSKVPCGKRLFSFFCCIVSPFIGAISPQVLTLTKSSAVLTIKERPWLHNPFSCISAGALVHLGETVSGLVVFSALQGAEKGSRGIVTSLSTTFLKKARGVITASADFTLPGKGEHETVVVSFLKNDKGEIVAEVGVTWTLNIVEGRKKKD